MSERSPEPAVVLTRGACAAKAALGPTAWAVLEELTLGAERNDDGRLVVTTSVRRLAAALSLDKDTVARALTRLAADGLVLRENQRPCNGSCYVIVSLSGLTRVGAGVDSDGVLADTAVHPSDGDTPGRPEVWDGVRPRRSRRTAVCDSGTTAGAGQLSLLGGEVAPIDATTTTPSPTPPPTTSTQQTTPIDQLDTEPDDDHHHRHPTSPIRISDSCHVCDEADATRPGGRSGGGRNPC